MRHLTLINLMQPSLGKDELSAVEDVFKSNWLGRGDVVTSFEAGFANSLVADPKDFYALSCCTEGLFLTADLFNFGCGDEIIVPSISFIAAGSAVVSSGASLVICDVDPRTLNATVETISACVTSKTKAIILNHYGGYPCDMDAICALAESNGIVIIEDAACAVRSFYKGQAVGTFGDMGIWSFDAMKTLVTGDGGMIYVADESRMSIAKEQCYLGLPSRDASGIDKIRDGSEIWWEVQINRPGRRAIMNNITAAIGLAQLAKVDSYISRRRDITEKYRSQLDSIAGLQLPPIYGEDIIPSYYFFWVQLDERDALAKFLQEKGIYTSFRYWPLSEVEFFEQYSTADLKGTETAAARTLNLPLHQGLSDLDVDYICRCISDFFEGGA